MEQIAGIFYNTILPPLLVFVLGYFMWVLQRRGGGSTVEELDKLLDQIQEERDNQSKKISELTLKVEVYKTECTKKVSEYQKHAQTVMDSDMKRIKNLETRLTAVEEEKEKYRLENVDLKKLVNRLTEKLSITEERLSVAYTEIENLKIRLVQVDKEVEEVKKDTGELKFPKGKDDHKG
jgi:chromosome segregation ATPase